MFPKAELTHQLFRGTSELVKVLRGMALGCDIAAAIIAAFGIWGTVVTKSGIFPLITLGLAASAILLRSWATSCRSFALACRKTSLRAFANGTDVDAITLTDFQGRVPPLVEWLADRLPAQNLEQYYEPTAPIGLPRQIELYAHSAFFTYRLTKTLGLITATVATAVFCFAFAAFYSLAMDEAVERSVREAVIATLCSSVFIIIFARLLQQTIACFTAAATVDRIEHSLLEKPDETRAKELADEYDIFRATSPDIPTWLYKWKRDSLQEQWHTRRTALQ